MPVYYRGPDVLITHREFAVRGPRPRVFAIAGLSDLHLTVGDRPRVFELRGGYAGQEAVLYASTNALVFGQVVRALVRALEANQYDREVRGAAGFH